MKLHVSAVRFRLAPYYIYSGRVAKRLNAADCKSAPSGSGVRIPLSPYLYGHSLKVELRSPKPSVWVRFLLPVFYGGCGEVVNTSDCGSDIRGFDSPHSPILLLGYSQAVRQGTLTPSCVGSNPATPVYIILPAWRNWQTRWTQNPVSSRTCRFDPGRRYSIMIS